MTITSTIITIIDATENAAVVQLDGYLTLAERLHGKADAAALVAAAIEKVYADRTNCSVSAKTFQNNLRSAILLVEKFGATGNAASKAIMAYNATAKRASYSVQVLQQKLAPVSVDAPTAKLSKLDKAVAAGIITAAQAAAIAAL